MGWWMGYLEPDFRDKTVNPIAMGRLARRKPPIRIDDVVATPAKRANQVMKKLSI